MHTHNTLFLIHQNNLPVVISSMGKTSQEAALRLASCQPRLSGTHFPILQTPSPANPPSGPPPSDSGRLYGTD